MPGPGAYLIGEEEKKEVLDVLESGYLVRYGKEDDSDYKRKVYLFEKELSRFIGVKYCVATNSGTSALISSIAALGIGPGDEIIVPGYTFISCISSIISARAIPILTEIDESLTINPEDIERKITEKTKAIMPVHMLGNPCNMDSIMKLAKDHGLYVIEDFCQANGGSYKGKKLGSIGDIGAVSLNWFKTITVGDGGALVTDNPDLYEKAFGFHDQGHKPLRVGLEIGKRSIIGQNLRMNEVTGAIALAQTRKLDKIITTLQKKKKKLKDMISGLPGIGFRKINDTGECATLLTLLFDEAKIADRFAEKIGTKTLIHSGWHVYNNMESILNKRVLTTFCCPFDCKEYGKTVEYKPHMLPQTDEILSRAVNISIGVVDPGIGASFGINILSTDDEINQVANRISEVIGEI